MMVCTSKDMIQSEHHTNVRYGFLTSKRSIKHISTGGKISTKLYSLHSGIIGIRTTKKLLNASWFSCQKSTNSEQSKYLILTKLFVSTTVRYLPPLIWALNSQVAALPCTIESIALHNLTIGYEPMSARCSRWREWCITSPLTRWKCGFQWSLLDLIDWLIHRRVVIAVPGKAISRGRRGLTNTRASFSIWSVYYG